MPPRNSIMREVGDASRSPWSLACTPRWRTGHDPQDCDPVIAGRPQLLLGGLSLGYASISGPLLKTT